jgi:DNA-directed RNA polymerase specialized sigma24 family protein
VENIPKNDDLVLKEARLREILSNLSSVEQDALRRYYALGQESEQISQALGMKGAQFDELRKQVRCKFFLSDRPNETGRKQEI